MGAFNAWFTSVLLIICGVIVFNHLGVNLAPALGTALHGVEHLLGTPLCVR
jgi:hypothetical protein